MSNRQIAYIICVFVGLLFGAITYFSHHLFGNVFITWVCAIPVIAMLAAGGWFAFGDVRLLLRRR